MNKRGSLCSMFAVLTHRRDGFSGGKLHNSLAVVSHELLFHSRCFVVSFRSTCTSTPHDRLSTKFSKATMERFWLMDRRERERLTRWSAILTRLRLRESSRILLRTFSDTSRRRKKMKSKFWVRLRFWDDVGVRLCMKIKLRLSFKVRLNLF